MNRSNIVVCFLALVMLLIANGRTCAEDNPIKLATLLPGDGTIYLVGTQEQWKSFSESFYPKEDAE